MSAAVLHAFEIIRDPRYAEHAMKQVLGVGSPL
jgi:hypothetical protein